MTRLPIWCVSTITLLSALCQGALPMTRDSVLRAMSAVMGELPDRRHLPALDVAVLERARADGYERRNVTFSNLYGERVTAYLYVPTDLQPGEKRPAVLALHPTGHLGKAIVDGQGPLKMGRGYAAELAARGYVVVAPDYPSFGDQKAYDFRASKYPSGTMKAISDNMRCVDLLESLPEVDGARVAAIGHSLGGHNALFAAAFDGRIRVVVTSCGWTPFHYYYGGKKLVNWAQERYMPRVRDRFQNDPDRMPFDFPELIAGAIAPRAVFCNSPVNDANFDVAGVRLAEGRIRPVYEAAGHGERFVVMHPGYAHDFQEPERRAAYRFIDEQLHFTPRREMPRD